MKIVAYCARSLSGAIEKATHTIPLTSPPLTLDSFKPVWLEGKELIYFKLHGLPDQAYWYGDNWTTALSANLIRKANLHNTIIFVANCYLYEKCEGSHKMGPMLNALLDAGASAVVGGPGKNYAKSDTIFGADQLGALFVRWIKLGFSALAAFNLAQKQFAFQAWQVRKAKQATKDERLAMKDTLEFQIFTEAP